MTMSMPNQDDSTEQRERQLFKLAMSVRVDPRPHPRLKSSPSSAPLEEPRRLVVAWAIGVNSAATTAADFLGEIDERLVALEERRGQYEDRLTYAAAAFRVMVVESAAHLGDSTFDTAERALRFLQLLDRGYWLHARSIAEAILLPRQHVIADVATLLADGADLPTIREKLKGAGAPLAVVGRNRNVHILKVIWGPVSDRQLRERFRNELACIHCGDRDCHVHCPLARGGMHQPATSGTYQCDRCGRGADRQILGKKLWWIAELGGIGKWISARVRQPSPLEEAMARVKE